MGEKHRVVILGGGFGGLAAAQKLKRAPVEVTLIDRRNFHLFQPLLYQVATGSLSPGEIAAPLRGVLSRQKNTRVLLGEAVDIDPQAKCVILRDGATFEYDSLIVATGTQTSYYGNSVCIRTRRARHHTGRSARLAYVRHCRSRCHRAGTLRSAGGNRQRNSSARLSKD